MKNLWRTYNFLLLIAGGIGIIAFGLVYFLSPSTRMELYGIRLEHRIALHRPESFLVGWHSNLASWTEHDGHLDTPLANETIEEVSTLLIERTQGTPAQNVLTVKPQEWIRSFKSADGFKYETIPLNHPSISPARIILDKQGTLLERQAAGAWRTARALQFLVPKFPKGPLRQGSTWTEHLEWAEAVGEWKIGWQAELQWVLKDFVTRYEKPCATLAYEVTLQPTVLQEPAWAKGSGEPVQFAGQARGEALYDIKNKFLISNTLSYSGMLKIHIPSLEKVPESLRVGLLMANTDGEVAFKLANKMDVRLP